MGMKAVQDVSKPADAVTFTLGPSPIEGEGGRHSPADEPLRAAGAATRPAERFALDRIPAMAGAGPAPFGVTKTGEEYGRRERSG